MRADELWIEAYQGEVLGEALFGRLADAQTDPIRARQMETLARMERVTKELAAHVLAGRGIDPGDPAPIVASAEQMAAAVTAMPWEQFIGSLEPATARFLATYRQLVQSADDDEERHVAEIYVAHERALAAFARRVLGAEPGDPVAPILGLPHVAGAAAR